MLFKRSGEISNGRFLSTYIGTPQFVAMRDFSWLGLHNSTVDGYSNSAIWWKNKMNSVTFSENECLGVRRKHPREIIHLLRGRYIPLRGSFCVSYIDGELVRVWWELRPMDP
jgi:hypothetical protein